jgi:nitric oxide reductase activation protein
VQVISDRIAVVLLVDESGSMAGDEIKTARKASILLWESLRHNKSVDVYIYGHTADTSYYGVTDINVYKEPTSKSYFTIGNMEAHNVNRDGYAIKSVALRVRAQTERKALFFVISDGQPYAHGYSGKDAVEDTRKKVIEVENMNMKVVQIAINHAYSPETMFKNYIILDDMNTFAFKLNKVIKDQVIRTQTVQTI